MADRRISAKRYYRILPAGGSMSEVQAWRNNEWEFVRWEAVRNHAVDYVRNIGGVLVDDSDGTVPMGNPE